MASINFSLNDDSGVVMLAIAEETDIRDVSDEVKTEKDFGVGKCLFVFFFAALMIVFPIVVSRSFSTSAWRYHWASAGIFPGENSPALRKGEAKRMRRSDVFIFKVTREWEGGRLLKIRTFQVLSDITTGVWTHPREDTARRVVPPTACPSHHNESPGDEFE